MARYGHLPSSPSLDDPTSQSSWTRRREDLQGIAGPSTSTVVSPYIDDPKSTVQPILPSRMSIASTMSSPGARSALTSWQGQRMRINGPNTHSIVRNPARAPGVTDQDVWSPLRVTGASPDRVMDPQTNQASQRLPYGPDEALSPASLPSQESARSILVNGRLRSDSGYSTGTQATESANGHYSITHGVRPNLLSPDGTGTRVSPQHPPVYPTPTGTGNRQRKAWHSTSATIHDSPQDQQQVCDFPDCPWVGKCPSDKRKHMCRHRKPFKCNQPGCPRTEGFGTRNDLERHQKCVHGIAYRDRSPKTYKCFGTNCPRADQIWPRYDNFRQHLVRIHPDEDVDALIARSYEWLEKEKQQQREIPYVKLDTTSLSPTTKQVDAPQHHSQNGLEESVRYPNYDCQGAQDGMTIHPGTIYQKSTSAVPPGPWKATDFDPDNKLPERPASSSKPIEVTGTRVGLDFPRAGTVRESVIGILEALEKALEEGAHSHTLPDLLRTAGAEEKQYLQKFFRSHRKQLRTRTDGSSRAPNAGPDLSDTDSQRDLPKYSCSYPGCPRQTRRKCEMKKHLSRHQRPYGCTFTNCNKRFGSKNDWKRHENTKHFQQQSWQCPEMRGDGKECGQIFCRRTTFIVHLRDAHGITTHGKIKESLRRGRSGRNGQVKFWCGFCRKVISLTTEGLTAWDERFDHIDTKHFKLGQDIRDWVPPPSDDILKPPDPSKLGSTSTSDDSCRSDEKGPVVPSEDFQSGLQDTFLPFYPLAVPAPALTQNVSFERERPAKRPRAMSGTQSPAPSAVGHDAADGEPQPKRANLGPTTLPTASPTLPQAQPAPRRQTIQDIADSLYFVNESGPTFITCCNCEPTSGPLPAQYKASNYVDQCVMCGHAACAMCKTK